MLAIFRSTIVALTALVWLSSTAWAAPQQVVFLHFNDWDQMEPAGPIAAVIEAERAAAEAAGAAVIVTFGGDLISPSLMSGIDKGAHMVDLAEAIGIDFATIGNHEFDFGDDILKARIAESDFPWISSNVTLNGEAFPGVGGTASVEIADYTIGFVGLTTPDTAFLSSPGPGIVFEDYSIAAARDVAVLKDNGADFIVVLSHGGGEMDHALVEAVADVDLVLGGHDHLARAHYDGRDALAAAGAQGDFIAKTTITLDRVERRGRTRLVWAPAFELIPTAGITPDAEVQAEVDALTARLDQELGQVIGTTTVDLDSRRASVRSQETTFGNLVAEAMRAATGSDVALTNGGGIRGDTLYPAGTELTRKTILSELPFGNSTVKLELTGAQLLETLEIGVSRVEDGAGRFPQVAGMAFSFDASKPVGARVSAVTVGGEAVNPNATYTLATNDYVARGGDDYTTFAAAKVLIDAAAGGLMATQVIDYIAARGTVSTGLDGRIKRLD